MFCDPDIFGEPFGGLISQDRKRDVLDNVKLTRRELDCRGSSAAKPTAVTGVCPQAQVANATTVIEVSRN